MYVPAQFLHRSRRDVRKIQQSVRNDLRSAVARAGGLQRLVATAEGRVRMLKLLTRPESPLLGCNELVPIVQALQRVDVATLDAATDTFEFAVLCNRLAHLLFEITHHRTAYGHTAMRMKDTAILRLRYQFPDDIICRKDSPDGRIWILTLQRGLNAAVHYAPSWGCAYTKQSAAS